MTDAMDQLFHDIMSQCQFGSRLSHFSDSVRDRLEKYERNVRKEIVSRMKCDRAPLFDACVLGNVEMVEYLISTCEADVEQGGEFFDDEGMVSPLWFMAASGGPMLIMECLISHDDVKYLVEHGADINRPNDSGRTCLMEAIRQVELCEFLLKNGADIDARDKINKTALHYAIEGKLLDAVKLLLDNGADATLRSNDNDDALQTACLVVNQPIFDYLVEHVPYSPGTLADANELMGSRCSFRNTETALKYWRQAIEIRNSNAVDGKPLEKTPSLPKRDCYRNASEFTTLDELNAIVLDSDALTIQYLLIHERILGGHHRATFSVLSSTGAKCARKLRYHDCLDFWKRALEISIVNDSILWRDVAHVARGLVGTLYYLNVRMTLDVAYPNRVNKVRARFADVVAVFKLLTNRLVTVQPPSEEVLAMDEEEAGDCTYDGTLRCIIYLIYLLLKTARTSGAKGEVRALVRDLVKRIPMSPQTHDTLLHLCVSRHSGFLFSHFQPFSCEYDYMNWFPNLKVVKLLLECEVDVNARNKDGQTPLHIASYPRKFSNQLVKLLLDHGAHLDTPAKFGFGGTPADLLSEKRNNTVDLMEYTTLRCLAARTIVEYEIQCNNLPASVSRFLDLHRPL